MVTEARHRPGESRGLFGGFGRSLMAVLWPTQRLLWTREGLVYIVVWIVLLILGLNQQINLILLVAGLAAGPVAASFLVSAAMLRKLRVTRRVPPFTFSGDPLHLDYTLENDRRWTAALALFIEDDVVPTDRTVSGSASVAPRVFFARVPGRGRARVRWTGVSPRRGNYKFRTVEMVTRSPFGLLERRVTVVDPDEMLVYPTIGRLTRRWHQVQRQASETRRGRRHDRSAQQQEYHGLRDYRPGDSPRWIHWRTSARLGQPMVKEFEQQNEQDLAILLDPWLPRVKNTPEQRETLEESIRFVATVCLETCRQQGRRIALGWTGPTPGVCQGPASVKMLHELLGQLAMMRPSHEGTLASLFDTLPSSTLRDSVIVVVSTRPVNLIEEAERSARLSGSAGRGFVSRVTTLDASRGDLADMIKYATTSSEATSLSRRDTASDPDEDGHAESPAGARRDGDRGRAPAGRGDLR